MNIQATSVAPKKVIFVGNTKSYKTFVASKLTNQKHAGTTMGVELYSYPTKTSHYNIWDCSGDDGMLFRGLGDGYYIGANIAFIFHDGKGKKTPGEWEREVKRVSPNIQIYHIKGDAATRFATVKNILA